LAEDGPAIAQIVFHVLRLLDCDATHGSDGQAATPKLATPSATDQALVLDLNLPGITGVDVLRQARPHSFPGPVIITSGRISADARRELLALRVSTILQNRSPSTN
jgi:DNA-binding response OmpR family regulator